MPWSVGMEQDGWLLDGLVSVMKRKKRLAVAQADAVASESGPAGADAELLHVMRPLPRAGCGGTVRDGVMWLEGALGSVGAELAGCCCI